MVRFSNILIGFVNTLTMLAAVALIGTSLYLRSNGHTECHRFLENSLMIIGGALLLVSALALIGSCCRINIIMWLYIFVLSLVIMGIVAFALFALLITNSAAGQAVSGRGYKEYRLGDFSNWMKNHVIYGNNWVKIRSCFVDSKLCLRLGEDVSKSYEFYKKDLSPIQSGCCKPPTYCGFTFINATFWEIPESGPEVPDSDCVTWSNHQDTLCYDCKSCKAGILENIKTHWKKIVIINVSVLLLICILQCIGTCAYRTNRYDRYKGYRSHY